MLAALAGALDEAPRFRVAAARLAEAVERQVQDRLAADYPNVTVLRLREVLESAEQAGFCDVVVRTNSTAATISKRPNGYSLAFVEGMTKPKVNGETVKDSVMLKEFDNIEFGSVKMQFFIKN